MITKELISPKSIVVVGGSDETQKPGGAVLRNLRESNYKGKLYVVNPKSDFVQGIKCHKRVEELPQVDLAILAIAAKMCPDSVEILCSKKMCKAVIILSAGFHEDGPEGAILEEKIVEIVNRNGASLIGPNCIGVMTPNYTGIFTKPNPPLSENGVDLISGSGATVVFILETALQLGVRVSSIFSVGNSAQTGIEDVLEYLDETYIHKKSAPVKLLYIESISYPEKLLKHAVSLINKGAKIAAIKSGTSDAGSRAASSHTGAMATPDSAVSALFQKAGIVRCYSRTELVTVGAVMLNKLPNGNKVAIITHAGGPAVMLTDTLSEYNISIPHISGEKADNLLKELYNGSSTSNPIDFLATGTASQLAKIIDACEKDFDVDSMVVIFGNPGLTSVYDVYETLFNKIKECNKPIFSILPSIVNAKDEIAKFKEMGGICFPDEVIFGNALGKVIKSHSPLFDSQLPPVDKKIIRDVIKKAENGYLSPLQVQTLLDAAGIGRVKEIVVDKMNQLRKAALEIGFPVVMKVVGPVHKTDVGGVILNVTDEETMISEFNRMMNIPGTHAIMLQPMLTGIQIFIGAKREEKFGHLVMCGLGGIFIEVLNDVQSALSPVSKSEAKIMISSLKGYKMIKGSRGIEGVNEAIFIENIRRVSALCNAAPEIYEMDLNPLLGNSKQIIAVDARIRIEK
ncbi:MAG TPA: acetate--CoA ligase family protein [Bacteroidales bacterium]|nr:acetate--CoA ligase family protein [Bacteroidales bacterium]HRT84057.1 acetate--CoA ligase family protein [Bacteroidales bacterium]